MKKLFVFFVLATLLAGGCTKKAQEKEYNIRNSVFYADGLKDYYYYDDILDEKPVISFDTTKFWKEVEDIIPYSKILNYYGPGYNSFYLMLLISKDRAVSFRFFRGIDLRPEMGYIMPNEDNTVLVSHHTNRINWTEINLFTQSIPDINNIFNAKIGKVNGSYESSIKLYEISVSLSEDSTIIKPWQIR